VNASLQQTQPILPLIGDLTPEQRQAQEIALRDPNLVNDARNPQTGETLRSEVFGIYPLRESDFTEATAACLTQRCYRVELYHYAYNMTITAVVDLNTETTITINRIPDTQPDIPPHLTELAVQIAVRSPEVANALGFAPGEGAAVMPNIKTALNQSRCERSRHLCVAPTFLQGERALWAIVDLTDYKLVGVRWTNLGHSSGVALTETTLENDVVMANFCDKSTTLAREGWEMEYILTSSDGLRIADVQFDGQPVIDNAKLVDWHVSYSNTGGFGYSDAIGCPVFSQAAVIAFSGPTVEEVREGGKATGFALVQDFFSELWPLPCNYYYQQRYEFYHDGRFRIEAINLGRGCGNNGAYRPVLRIRLAGSQYTFAEWDGQDWQDWHQEQWRLQTDQSAYTLEGYQYRLLDQQGHGFFVLPNRGQLDEKGRSDNAYTYVTRYHADVDEGESDLITIGPCCNEDHQQGPEKFMTTPEEITGQPLVLWYVPQLKNDDTPGQEYCWSDARLEAGVYVPKVWPCAAGLFFVPIEAIP
jgi:hypothetical protein